METTKSKVIECLNGLIQSIEKLSDDLPIDLDLKFTNLGIEKIDYIHVSDGYVRYIDLGGRSVKIELTIPNHKNRIEEIEKALKK